MHKLDYLKLHLSVLLAGFTGIFAKLISLNEVIIVFYRMLLAFIFFGIYMTIIKKIPKESIKEINKIGLLGILLAIHLIFFFGSIKYSNVSIGTVCYSLVGFFAVFLEPCILKSKFSYKELIYSLISIFGIGLIFGFSSEYRFGIILGIISAGLFAVYTIYNKIIEQGKSSKTMLFYELLGGSMFMCLFIPVYLKLNPAITIVPVLSDWFYLIILALFCTVILYLLHISVLKTISAFTVSLTGNLEPVYGVLFAIIFLNEAQELTPTFYIGMLFIIISVYLQSIVKNDNIS